MKMKTVLLVVVMGLLMSLLTAGLVVVGNAWMKSATEGGANPFATLFSKKEVPLVVGYVEQKNMMITLKGNGERERYLMLDLAFVTHSEREAAQTELDMPKLKFLVVEMFSGMQYASARLMTVEEIRMQMMSRFQSAYAQHLPFQDVLIAKMVYQ